MSRVDANLRACPLCAGKASMTRTRDTAQYWFVQCENHRCGCRIWAMPDQEAAAEAWNRRIEEKKPHAQD
jgi:tRNA(Arg) A34 adenosine deaminase TadA